MACRVSEGGARSKRTPCRYVNRRVRVAITLTHNLPCRARARGVGPVQSLSPAACKPAVQPCDPKGAEKKCRGGGRFELWQSEAHDTACTRMRTLFPLFEINQVSANDRTRRTQERRWKARRQSQQAPPDTWPARDKRPAAMAAGADESPRGTAAPAHGLRRGSAALLSHPQGLTPFKGVQFEVAPFRL